MNIIILSCLNLDLLDLYRFTEQFKPSISTGPVKYFLIDHVGEQNRDTQSLHLTQGQSTIDRIDINKFIQDEIEYELIIPAASTYAASTLATITTRQIYKEYLAFLTRAAAPNRKLIENIFYYNPRYIEFIKYYLFSINKLVSKLVNIVAETNKGKIQVISCDPIFHYLLAELRKYHPGPMDIFYSQFLQGDENLQLIVCAPPSGWPLAYPPGVAITKLNKTTFAKFSVPYLEQLQTTMIPQILLEFRTDNDIYNLDMLTDYITSGRVEVLKGEVNGVLGLDDINTGLKHIFEDQLINRNLRVPRHLLPSNRITIEIEIHPQQIPHIPEIRVLEDISQQLEPGLLDRHRELLSRELQSLEPELDNIALEWELRIQKYIKLPIKIRFA